MSSRNLHRSHGAFGLRTTAQTIDVLSWRRGDPYAMAQVLTEKHSGVRATTGQVFFDDGSSIVFDDVSRTYTIHPNRPPVDVSTILGDLQAALDHEYGDAQSVAIEVSRVDGRHVVRLRVMRCEDICAPVTK